MCDRLTTTTGPPFWLALQQGLLHYLSWRNDLLWGVTATHRVRLKLLVLVAICHLILFPESSAVDIVCAVIPLSINFPRQKKSGAQKGGGPRFRAFFPPPAIIFILLSLSWGPSVEFWWYLKRRGPEMCTFGFFFSNNELPQANLSFLSTSCTEGASAPVPGVKRLSNKDKARDLAAAQARMPLQRRMYAAFTRFCRRKGEDSDLAFANERRNCAVSSDHRPPTSAASTTRRAPSLSRELWVGRFLLSAGLNQRHPVTLCSPWPGSAVTTDW